MARAELAQAPSAVEESGSIAPVGENWTRQKPSRRARTCRCLRGLGAGQDVADDFNL
jgi:hypothetical protein